MPDYKIDLKSGMTHQQFAQACWDSFEPHVRNNPAPWLWMYKHWRYRPANAPRPYPFYANVEPRFDKLVNAQLAERTNSCHGLKRDG